MANHKHSGKELMRQSALRLILVFLLGLFICLLPLQALPHVPFNTGLGDKQQLEQPQGLSIARGGIGRVLPQAAIVNATKGKGLTIVEGIKDLGGARVDDKVAYNRRLDVPGGKGNGATLGFVSQLKQRIGGYLAAAGFSKASSEYFYPCGAKGSFAIGWESGTRDGCPKIQYRATTKIGPGRKSLTTEDSSNVQQKAQDNTVARVHLQQYCSVASNDHDEWSVNLTKEAWEQGKTEEVCEKALKECQEKSGGSCSIVSRDNWYSLAPSAPKVSLLLECADGKRYFRQGTGPDVHKLREDIEKEARGQNAAACAFNIFSHDEVLISPASDERTLIHTDSTDQGFVINDLVGTVEITPPGDPRKITPVLLNPGQRYEYRNTAAAVRTLERSEREAVTNLPVVQEFLRLNNWVNEIDPEIEKYQAAILDQFLKPIAVRVEQKTVDGVSIWLTSIDLNQPETIVTLTPTAQVRQAGGLSGFAKSSGAGVIANGTFREDENWTMISEGRTIVGERSKNWSNYTVLGLKSKNEPEMTARGRMSGAQWNQYWFALTGHPRLVSNGVAGVTELSQGSTLNVSGAAERAAVGFSKKTKTLYHVITNEGVSLARLAAVMRAIGCDEAMNLEGGGGKVLAKNGKVLVSGEVRAPLITVHNSERPAPDRIRQSWLSFNR